MLQILSEHKLHHLIETTILVSEEDPTTLEVSEVDPTILVSEVAQTTLVTSIDNLALEMQEFHPFLPSFLQIKDLRLILISVSSTVLPPLSK